VRDSCETEAATGGELLSPLLVGDDWRATGARPALSWTVEHRLTSRASAARRHLCAANAALAFSTGAEMVRSQ
jgi:hypothetical protein